MSCIAIACSILKIMFKRVFNRHRSSDIPRLPSVPADSLIYAIGDIHGRADMLARLHGLIQADAARRQDSPSAQQRTLVIYLGDYIDRGPESRAVIDLLLHEKLAGFESIFLKGNHEDSLLRFLDDEQIGPAWLTYGGAGTLYSYGIRPPDPSKPEELAAARQMLIDKLPAEHLAFYRDAKLLHIEGDYAFVHAGVRPRLPLNDQAPEDLMWIRDEFLQSGADFGKIIVHGHSITDRPDVRPNRIGIDTGAFATGRLTSLVLQGTERSFIAT